MSTEESKSTDNNEQYEENENTTPVDKKIRSDIVLFLRDLADKLEKNELSPELSLKISEFFMRSHFNAHCSNVLRETTPSTEVEDAENVDDAGNAEELMKFMSLGWYVYKHLMPYTE